MNTTDSLFEESALVCANKQVGPGLFGIELESPRIARSLQPGQFVHLQVPGMPDKILRRPFSVFDTDPRAGTMLIIYQVVGAGTAVLSGVASGEKTSLIGPVGNAWRPPPGVAALLVGGGVGAAPLFMLASRLSSEERRLRVVLGAQSAAALVTLDYYRSLGGVEVVCATDDGSYGHAGFCTEPAFDALATKEFGYVAVCGPEPLMRIVSSEALASNIACQVSLERRMACGVGACLSCVVDTASGKKRCCIDGPIFDAGEVVWQ